jgi:molecular chaperone DnaK (HSP70)
MAVFGVDLGNLNSVIAVTRNGGIDVIINEVSKRETSAFVSLTDQERFIGEAGLDRSVRNAVNTVACVKRFIGMRLDDPDVQLEKRFLTAAVSGDDQGRLMFNVNYNGESISLYPEQVLAMFMQQLRKYVNIETAVDKKVPADVRDCVLTVPCFFTAEQRRLTMQACEIAGINCMSLINESTAASIDYGIFRGSSLPEKEADAQIVAIVDCGYGTTTVAVTAFWKGNLKVLGRVFEKHLGTRDLDWALLEHFADEIKKKYKVDALESKKQRLRLLQACEKVKLLLSGNQTAPLNIENLNDVDVAINGFSRADFEELTKPLQDRLRALFSKALVEANVAGERLHSIEVIGGGCRIPFIKRVVEEAFGKSPSFTLNASESVARGAAITAAVFSPKYQVREFVVNEISQFPLKCGYYLEGASAPSAVPFLPQINKVVGLLGKGDTYPKLLEVTIKRADSFTLWSFYDDENADVVAACRGGSYITGEWTIGAPSKPTNGEVKVRVRLLASGIVTVESASTQEVYEVEETEEKKDPENPEKVEKVTVKKSKNRRLELTVTPNVGILGLASETIVRAKKLEEEMHRRDLSIVRTKESKNALESYILDNRSRVADGGIYSDFILKENKAAFLKLCNDDEEWLYDEGSESTFEEYSARLEKLKALCAPAANRHRLADDIPFALKQFVTAATALKDTAIAKKGAAAHITEEEIDAVAGRVMDGVQWATAEVAAYQADPKTNDPRVTPQQFDAKLKELEVAVKAVINKPAPPPPKKTPVPEEPKPATENPPPPPPQPETAGPEKPTDLD